MRIIAFITETAVVRDILLALGETRAQDFARRWRKIVVK